jgi:hypothetical protein
LILLEMESPGGGFYQPPGLNFNQDKPHMPLEHPPVGRPQVPELQEGAESPTESSMAGADISRSTFLLWHEGQSIIPSILGT